MIDREKLSQAATLIRYAMGKLDTRETVCEHCKIPHRENFAEFLLHKQLGAMAEKLVQAANSKPK
jgi:hypothetical protein